MESRVRFAEKAVWIDGRPVQLLSGAIHYFRVHPAYWRDRLQKAAQCGLNCVETYLCWNLHEPREGEFDFSGMLDFAAFIRAAQEAGLWVIVRPGPYICAEWDNGGLPAWLMLKPGIRFRRSDPVFLPPLKKFLARVVPVLRELQYDNGGPVIAVQIENEYGSYGHDREYLAALRDFYRSGGLTVPLFTADGGSRNYLANGLLEGTPAALTFGSRALDAFHDLRQFRPDDPLFCVEFWGGWFDNWGDPHHARPAAEVADELDDILTAGGSINFYMFHGGTNFGFTAGANGRPGDRYTPDTTSYDYDSPLTEWGAATEKYFAIQSVIKRHFPEAKTAAPAPVRLAAYGKCAFTATAPLFANLDRVGRHRRVLSPLTMEELGQQFGFVHYRTHFPGPVNTRLSLWGAHDRARVFVGGKSLCTYFRNDAHCETPNFDVPAAGVDVDILVENFGRVNYGPLVGRDFKGLTEGVTDCMGANRFYWDVWGLPLETADLEKLEFGPFAYRPGAPAFHRAVLTIDDEPADTFLRFPGVCGVAWVNGFNLGRYWNVGPGDTLYVPAPVLRRGANEVLVFETDDLARPYANFVTRG